MILSRIHRIPRCNSWEGLEGVRFELCRASGFNFWEFRPGSPVESLSWERWHFQGHLDYLAGEVCALAASMSRVYIRDLVSTHMAPEQHWEFMCVCVYIYIYIYMRWMLPWGFYHEITM